MKSDITIPGAVDAALSSRSSRSGGGHSVRLHREQVIFLRPSLCLGSSEDRRRLRGLECKRCAPLVATARIVS